MFKIECDRCGCIEDVEFALIDTGYWIAPKTWLTAGNNCHLCDDCKKRALEKIVEQATD